MRKRRAVPLALAAALCIAWPQAVSAASLRTESQPVILTSRPAYYGFTKTVTLTNKGRNAALNVQARVVLLAPTSAYAHVNLVGYSKKPRSTHRDKYGNLIALYTWSSLKPGRSVTIKLHYQATSSDISYKLPRTYPPYNENSRTYQRYTNPKLEASKVDTGAPAIIALDNRVAGSASSPYQRALDLFNWVVYHIRYNYSLKSSGSALATLNSREGICSNIAELYVGMLRTDHIPARLIDGYVTNNGAGQSGFHQWVEFYLPHTGWVVADPTWGRYGYFAALQDDWHIPLYDGIRPDISVDWQYVKTSTQASPYIAISYHYHFVTEQSPSESRHVKLPLVSVRPPVAKHQASLATARSFGQDWLGIRTFFHQYVLRLKIVLESL